MSSARNYNHEIGLNANGGHHSRTFEPTGVWFSRVTQCGVWDLRSHPGSRYAQFSRERLEVSVPAAGIVYRWEPRLGGWRDVHLPLATKFAEVGVDITAYVGRKFPKQRIAAALEAQTTPCWYNAGLYDYQWFMTLEEFLVASDDLIEAAKRLRVGIMCAEVLPWKCHRSMVCDYLWYRGVDAIHLQPKLKPHSAMLGNRLDRYLPAVKEIWQRHGK